MLPVLVSLVCADRSSSTSRDFLWIKTVGDSGYRPFVREKIFSFSTGLCRHTLHVHANNPPHPYCVIVYLLRGTVASTVGRTIILCRARIMLEIRMFLFNVGRWSGQVLCSLPHSCEHTLCCEAEHERTCKNNDNQACTTRLFPQHTTTPGRRGTTPQQRVNHLQLMSAYGV